MRVDDYGERPEGRLRTQPPNRAPAPCARCRTTIAPGEGRVWRCRDPEHCVSPDTCVRGWHCSCLDERACAARALARKLWEGVGGQP